MLTHSLSKGIHFNIFYKNAFDFVKIKNLENINLVSPFNYNTRHVLFDKLTHEKNSNNAEEQKW